jgi:hypothetical protein
MGFWLHAGAAKSSKSKPKGKGGGLAQRQLRQAPPSPFGFRTPRPLKWLPHVFSQRLPFRLLNHCRHTWARGYCPADFGLTSWPKPSSSSWKLQNTKPSLLKPFLDHENFFWERWNFRGRAAAGAVLKTNAGSAPPSPPVTPPPPFGLRDFQFELAGLRCVFVARSRRRNFFIFAFY